MSNKYIVTSMTSRDSEGFADFCWMEISKKKLLEAVKDKERYYFRCSVGGVVFVYSYPAVDLLDAFETKYVRLRGGKTPRYSFFIEYPTGKIYCRLSHADPEVCTLNLEALQDGVLSDSDKRVISSEWKAEEMLAAALKAENCDHLLKLVARTALWATKKEYAACLEKKSPAKHPNIRRKYSYESRGVLKDGTRLDDNSYPNAQMKASLKKRGISPIGYETCHIWDGTCYDPRYHTCFANLVLLPRALASLSDHNAEVKALLRWHAYERFDHFFPAEQAVPSKPKIYDEIKHLFND